MNFLNFAFSFAPTACLYSPDLPYTLFAPPLSDSHYMATIHPNPPLMSSVKTPNSFQQINFAKIEQRLKQMHLEGSISKKTHWTVKQDQLLQKLVEVQRLEWRQIPKYFEGRSQSMCYSRYRRIATNCKERTWTKQDEQAVTCLVDRLGQKWKLISQRLPKFTPKQIREKYLNYLRPNITKAEFTLEQDREICKYILEHGKHWRKIQELLPGRSEGNIKSRYYGKLQQIVQTAMDDQQSIDGNFIGL